jgi:hypothetical protein
MKNIENIDLPQLLIEAENSLLEEKKNRVKLLLISKLRRKEELEHKIENLKLDLEDVNVALKSFGAGDWTKLSWVGDSSTVG